MTKEIFIQNLTNYLNYQINELSNNIPILNIFNPIIKLSIKNNLDKLDGLIKYITDNSGNINIEEALNETISNIENSNNFSTYIPIIGNLEIKDKCVLFNLPILNTKIKLSMNDLNIFKNYILHGRNITTP